jgi:predicted ATPase
VDLAQIQDPKLVVQAVADALSVSSQANRSLETLLFDFLQSRSLLLILDNCEHMVEETARVSAALLVYAPSIQILTTSQVPLGLAGETEWLVPSLSLPDVGQEPGELTQWMDFAAIRLFVERARSIRSDFSLTSQNARAVLEVCRRLDGIPLAIELAAARIKLLTVEEIASRLDDRFTLLTGAKRFVTSRHQTLAAAINWSYELLSTDEQKLLNRLSVFSGSWTLEAAEAVCADDTLASAMVLDLLSRLVDRSLVVTNQADHETHYRLLDSIRLFALDHLTTTEQYALKDRLLDWYDRSTALEFPYLHGPRQVEIVRHWKDDLPNLRTAVDWALAHPAPDTRLLQGLRIAAATSWAMRISGHIEISGAWLEGLLSKCTDMEGSDWIVARAEAHLGLSRQYWLSSAYRQGQEHALASLRLFERSGKASQAGQLNARHLMYMNTSSSDPAQDYSFLLELIEGFQSLGDQRGSWNVFSILVVTFACKNKSSSPYSILNKDSRKLEQSKIPSLLVWLAVSLLDC